MISPSYGHQRDDGSNNKQQERQFLKIEPKAGSSGIRRLAREISPLSPALSLYLTLVHLQMRLPIQKTFIMPFYIKN